jgi:hypothetical protein
MRSFSFASFVAAVVCVVAGTSAALYVFFWPAVAPISAPVPPAAPESTVPELRAVDPVVDPVILDPAPFYRRGYASGYYSFLAQSGTYAPLPAAVVAIYTSMTGEAENVQPDYLVSGVDLEDVSPDDAYNQGYTDGYHKASEGMYCPRSNYGR